jgi:hypothetical protein
MGGQASGLMTFGVKGGRAGGERFLDALKLFTRLVNIGDAKSLATHPASTTHRQLSPEPNWPRPASAKTRCGCRWASSTSTTAGRPGAGVGGGEALDRARAAA